MHRIPSYAQQKIIVQEEPTLLKNDTLRNSKLIYEFKNLKVLCLVTTSNLDDENKSVLAVKATWGKRSLLICCIPMA